MILSIPDLRTHLSDQFNEEAAGSYFGFIDTSFIYKYSQLVISLAHYKTIGDQKYRLVFKDVLSFRITDEIYLSEMQEEIYTGYSFLWQIHQAKYKQEFGSDSSYAFIHGSDRFERVKCFRVVAQNNFIDILCDEEPTVELIKI